MSVQGLWVHGNLLERLPDSLGRLSSLRMLSLAGNCLVSIPPSLGDLQVDLASRALYFDGCVPCSVTKSS